jgi:hypothetical protein
MSDVFPVPVLANSTTIRVAMTSDSRVSVSRSRPKKRARSFFS